MTLLISLESGSTDVGGKARALVMLRHMLVAAICVSLHTMCHTVTVTIPQGQVKGTTLYTANGRQIFAFYNIPYAKPPIDLFRFREPQPAEGWEGVRDASARGPACLQHITQSFKTTGEEDCLYLNIFTPVLPNVSAIPPWFSTIVFFHNGVFITGDANLFQPTYLLDQDVILVTVNYRLGVLGFLSTEDSEVPGNNGLKDQVAALRWVKNYIER